MSYWDRECEWNVFLCARKATCRKDRVGRAWLMHVLGWLTKVTGDNVDSLPIHIDSILVLWAAFLKAKVVDHDSSCFFLGGGGSFTATFMIWLLLYCILYFFKKICFVDRMWYLEPLHFYFCFLSFHMQLTCRVKQKET